MTPFYSFFGTLVGCASRALHVFFGFGNSCRFVPTCSEFAKEALVRHGIFRGSRLIASRLLSCHPFHRSGYDPVPHFEGT